MHIKPIRLVITFFLFVSSFSVATVASAQTSGGGAAYVTENGSTRALTSGEVSLAAQTPAQMEAAAPVSDDIVHPIPQLPIVIDGVRYAPEDISQFNGRLLRYVLDQHGQSEGVIYAFTTLEGLTQYLKDQWGWEPTGTSARASVGTGIVRPMSDSYWTVFYADAYYAGSTIISAPNAAIADLSTVSPGWNDRISSVKVATGSAWATLYADTSYAGDQLWMQRGTEWSSLSGSGWDNRASSLKVWLN